MGQITPDVNVRNISFDLCIAGVQMQGPLPSDVVSFSLAKTLADASQELFFPLVKFLPSILPAANIRGFPCHLFWCWPFFLFVCEKSIDTLFPPDPAIAPPACVAADVFRAYCKLRLGLLSGGWSNSESKGEEGPPAGSELHRCNLSSQINARQSRLLLPPSLLATGAGESARLLGLFFLTQQPTPLLHSLLSPAA